MSSEIAADPRNLIYNDRFTRQDDLSSRSSIDDSESLLSAIYSKHFRNMDRGPKSTNRSGDYFSENDACISESFSIFSLKQGWTEPVIPSASVDSKPESFDITDAVAAIRTHFSLQIKELALILGVQRPTIYAWLRDEAKPQPENRERISQVLRFVRRWQEFERKPLGELVRYRLDRDGHSLIDLLSEKTLDECLINSYLSELASAKSTRPPSLSEIAEREGFDLSKVAKSDLEFDLLTGRSFDEE